MRDDPREWMYSDPREEYLLSLPECGHCEGLGLLDNGHESIECVACEGTGRVVDDQDDQEKMLGVDARHDMDDLVFTEDPFDPPDHHLGEHE
jgi:hypothetical protein